MKENSKRFSSKLREKNKSKKKVLLGGQLHAAVLRAVFGVGSCSLHTVRSQALTLTSAISQIPPLAVPASVFVLLLLLVAT